MMGDFTIKYAEQGKVVANLQYFFYRQSFCYCSVCLLADMFQFLVDI